MLEATSTLPALPAGTRLLVSLQARSVSPLTTDAKSPISDLRKLPTTKSIVGHHRRKLLDRGDARKLQYTLTPTRVRAFPDSPFLPSVRTDLHPRKLWLRKQLYKHYRVRLSLHSLRHLSESQLCDLAVQRRRQRLATSAAQAMRRWLHSRRLLKAVSLQKHRMHMAAFVIQQYWKRYVVLSMQRRVKRPRERLELMTHSALVIQRYYRGHMGRERAKAKKLMADLDRMHKYYVGIKEAMQSEKAMKILMQWRRFQLAKRIKKRVEASKLALAVEASPPHQSKWDFKPIIKGETQNKKQVSRLAADRPASIKTNPSWKQKALEMEPITPRIQRMKTRELEPASPTPRKLTVPNAQLGKSSNKRGSTASTEPNTPISSGVETRARMEKTRLLLAGLDKIDEVEA